MACSMAQCTAYSMAWGMAFGMARGMAYSMAQDVAYSTAWGEAVAGATQDVQHVEQRHRRLGTSHRLRRAHPDPRLARRWRR